MSAPRYPLSLPAHRRRRRADVRTPAPLPPAEPFCNVCAVVWGLLAPAAATLVIWLAIAAMGAITPDLPANDQAQQPAAGAAGCSAPTPHPREEPLT